MTPRAASLHIAHNFPASPARLFDAWTTPDGLKRWTCPDPGAIVDVDIDLRPGGRYSIRMHVEGGPVTAHGAYREIDRPNRLVYTWAWAEDSHPMRRETLVTVELAPTGDGTEVRLTHEGFPTPADRDGHEEGWRICLGRLAELIARAPDLPDDHA